MEFFARLETACASAVERTFALAFPSAIEPVQIARKLVAAYESGAATSGRGGRRFIVRTSAADYARFAANRDYLERQWLAMLARLAERSGKPQRAPEVRMEVGPGVATGTVAIVIEALAEPTHLALRVRKGMPPDARMTLEGDTTVGRDPACNLVLGDPRVSRRHLAVSADAGGLAFRDLGSANGTTQNGERVASGTLGLGDILVLGDTELVVEAAE